VLIRKQEDTEQAEVKFCKFLNPYNLIVTADLDGMLNFYSVYPAHNRNTHLCSVKDDIESEVGTVENFPIRSLDFDEAERMIYTGDEMGNMHKWDVRKLIENQEEEDSKYDGF